MIYRKGATAVDQCAHRLMEYKISTDWHGSTVVDDYVAYYHEERLYTVRHLKKGISCLVYARSPYDAIESVRTMEKDAPSQAYSWLVKDLRITADGLPNKFSQNDELFQVLYDAADAIEKLTGTTK